MTGIQTEPLRFCDAVNLIRRAAVTERGKGAKFEEFICRCWKTDPQYGPRTANIWLWNDFPGRDDLGGKDLGIDLVAQMKSEGAGDDEFWAIQCKCYDKNTCVTKAAVDSFISDSMRTFSMHLPDVHENIRGGGTFVH